MKLAWEYCRAPIVLYTGAGVSVGGSRDEDGRLRYGVPTWFELLKEIAGANAPASWPRDPWDAADRAVNAAGGIEAFRTRLRMIIERPSNYTQKHGQVPSAFLRDATTLRSVAGFAGRLTARLTNPIVENPSKVSFRSGANPRVHAVLTVNYDCFLESAASALYRRSPLRSVTALGSPAASATRVPVFHVHGYIPHPFYQDKVRTPTVEELVITRQDYERTWRKADVFGTTMGPQIHLLRYYTALFVGFSFTDKYVNELLRRIKKDYLDHARRKHFAFVQSSDIAERGQCFYEDLGIEPIEFDEFVEIPERLGELYRAGLVADRIFANLSADGPLVLPELHVKSHERTGRSYRYPVDASWKIVQCLRNETVGSKFVKGLGEQRVGALRAT